MKLTHPPRSMTVMVEAFEFIALALICDCIILQHIASVKIQLKISAFVFLEHHMEVRIEIEGGDNRRSIIQPTGSYQNKRSRSNHVFTKFTDAAERKHHMLWPTFLGQLDQNMGELSLTGYHLISDLISYHLFPSL